MKFEDLPDGGCRLTLDASEARLLRIALERATFVDTRPEDQEAVYRFADALVSRLQKS